MRNRQLRSALHDFAEESAWQLASDVAEGHEMAFEVVSSGGPLNRRRETQLYCYRPLTADFIDRRLSILQRLPSYLPAVHALGTSGGLDEYLRAHVAPGIPRDARDRAELALRAFLGAVFEDQSEFVLDEGRFERAYGALEELIHEGRTETVLCVPVLGLLLQGSEVPMGDGLTLVRADVLEDRPPAQPAFDADAHPVVLAVLRWEPVPGDEAPFEHARTRLARMQTALRLYDEAGVTLAASAWTRTAGGPWTAMTIGGTAGGRPVSRCLVTAEQEDELRAFCSLVTRRTPRNGELAWALRRFELGCSRERVADTLTDHLLALRALLEPEGPASGRLAGRVAALCAEPDERAGVTQAVIHAVALERALITGIGMPDAAVAADLCAEITDDLRAILRDVLCGHLDAHVAGVADRLIAAGSGFAEPEVPAVAAPAEPASASAAVPAGEQVELWLDDPEDDADA